jgi:SAM-dependent methyltransferase
VGKTEEEKVREPPPPDIFHVTRDDDYLRQLRAEEEFWDKRVETPLSRTPPPMVQGYYNERLTGRTDRQWFEMIDDFGDFRRGCALGAGPGKVESYLLDRHKQLCLTFYDISGEALARVHGRLEKEFPGRTDTRQEDLNFVTLPAETYDLIIANSSVHHIMNLEHLAFQVNKCLTPEGHFFMYDNVGESYFQFSEEKKRLFQALAQATMDYPGRSAPIQWPDRSNWTFSPFESARSEEILDVFRRYLEEVRVRTVGALLSLTMFAQGGSAPPQSRAALSTRWRRLLSAAALRARLRRRKIDVDRARARTELLFMLDRIVTETGYLKPGLAFAIYRKRGTGDSSG